MLKQETRFMFNSFGFDSMCEFANSAFRIRELHLIAPLALTMALLDGILHYVFGLEAMMFMALVALFVLEIISGIWASKIKYKYYINILSKEKGTMNSEELTLVLKKVERYKFSSSKLKRAGVVMGFWLIILAIIWQFTHFDHSTILSTIFNTLHIIFVSYIIGVYLVSVVENVAVMSGKQSKFMNLKDLIERELTLKK